jgi:hypothetical protein
MQIENGVCCIHHSTIFIGLGPWPSGKASPLHGEDRRFESGRVHFLEMLIAFLTGEAKSV